MTQQSTRLLFFSWNLPAVPTSRGRDRLRGVSKQMPAAVPQLSAARTGFLRNAQHGAGSPDRMDGPLVGEEAGCPARRKGTALPCRPGPTAASFRAHTGRTPGPPPPGKTSEGHGQAWLGPVHTAFPVCSRCRRASPAPFPEKIPPWVLCGYRVHDMKEVPLQRAALFSSNGEVPEGRCIH